MLECERAKVSLSELYEAKISVLSLDTDNDFELVITRQELE